MIHFSEKNFLCLQEPYKKYGSMTGSKNKGDPSWTALNKV